MSREHLPCVFLSQTKIVKKNARKTTPIGRKNNLNEKKKWQVAPPIVRRLSQGVGASVQERVVGLLAGIRNTVLQGGSVARLGSSLGAAGYSCRPDDTSVGGAGRELPVPLCIDTTWAPPPPSLVPLPPGRTRRPAPPSSNTHPPAKPNSTFSSPSVNLGRAHSCFSRPIRFSSNWCPTYAVVSFKFPLVHTTSSLCFLLKGF